VKTTLASARDEMIERHRGLAVSLAARFSGRGEEMDDLIQVALIGLTKAVDRYDPDRGTAITTFATATILGELKRHFRDRAWAVRPPRRVHELFLRVQPVLDELHQELGRSPRIDEVARRVGASAEEVLEAMEAGSRRAAMSLDAAPADERARPISLTLGAEDERFAGIDNHLSVQPLLARLPEREREIICLRFFTGLSQSEIAEQVGMSQMHVSRLLTRTLNRMRIWAADAAARN
jgi:RNA polymerase sigma-B factor